MVKVTIIGTTHIDTKSPEKVLKTLLKIKPDAVCLELDKHRLEALIEIEKDGTPIPSDSYLTEDSQRALNNSTITNQKNENFSMILDSIGSFENELAHILKSEQTGKEMLVAFRIAEKISADVHLIDYSIYDISQVIEEEVSKKEATKFQNMLNELFKNQKITAKPVDKKTFEKDFLSNLEKNDELANSEINLNEVIEIFKNQEFLSEILLLFKENFPKLYSILLEKRNTYMVNQILKISPKYSNIVVVLGYGHVAAISNELKKLAPEIKLKIIN